VHPDDLARVREAEELARRTGGPYSVEHRIVRTDGQVRWVHERADIFLDENGRFRQMIGVVQDITERRNFEQSLADSEKRYRTLFENNPVPMWVHERSSLRFLAVNHAAVRAYGYSESEFLSMTIRDMRPEEEAPGGDRWVGEFTGAMTGRVWRHRRKNGEEFDAEITAHTIEFRGVDAVLAIANDVTERERAQRALAESEERYRRLAEHGAVGIWEVDLSHHAIYANPTMLAMLEVETIEELRARPFDGYFTHESLQVLKGEMARRARGEASVYEVELVGAQGGRRIAVVSGAPMVDPRRELTSFVATFTDITPRKMAERALASSEARFRRVVDSNMMGIFFWKLTGEITDCNDLFLKMIGRTREELRSGKVRWDAMTPPEWAEADRRATDQLLRDGVCSPYEKEYSRPDGRRIPVLLGAGFMEGSRDSGVCFIVDVTDRKLAEEQLRIAEAKYRTLFEEGPDGVMIVDPESARPIEANTAMARMLGYSREELLRLSVSDFEAIETPEQVREHIAMVLERGESDFETRMRTKTGRLIEAAVKIRVVRIGGVSRLQTLVRDITERKQADERLRAAEQRNALMIRQTPLGVIVWDLERRVVEWNPTAERIFGYSAEEAMGKTFDTLLVPPPIRPYVANIWKSLLDRSGGGRSTNENVTKDGRRILCEWYNSVLVGAGGDIIAVASLVQDVTDVKRLEDELRQSQKMEAIGQLASGVAHDFSNLLTAIFGFTSLARRTLSPQHAAVRSLDRVDDAAQQAAGVTRALLTFSRGGESEKKPVRLGQIVDDAVRLLRRTLPTNIEIRTSIDAEPIWVKADRTQLQQVVMNLAINARDAMPEGGTMTLSVGSTVRPSLSGETGDYGWLRVADTGIGMTTELQGRIFEPFFTTKPAGQGTGLGLSIIHGIVKDHLGQIDVQSSPGEGSTFTVLIPSCPPPQTSEAEEESGALQPGKGEMIIVANARTYIREIMATSLVSLGYRVVQVADGAGLEQALGANGARVVVLDMESLGRDATGLINRSSESGLGVVAILDSPDATILGQLPRVTVLQKPFQMPELAAAVREVLP
jgi:PAS domain S-box-containing protein